MYDLSSRNGLTDGAHICGLSSRNGPTGGPYMDLLPELYGPHGPYMDFLQKIRPVRSTYDRLRRRLTEDFQIQSFVEIILMITPLYLQLASNRAELLLERVRKGPARVARLVPVNSAVHQALKIFFLQEVRDPKNKFGVHPP